MSARRNSNILIPSPSTVERWPGHGLGGAPAGALLLADHEVGDRVDAAEVLLENLLVPDPNGEVVLEKRHESEDPQGIDETIAHQGFRIAHPVESGSRCQVFQYESSNRVLEPDRRRAHAVSSVLSFPATRRERSTLPVDVLGNPALNSMSSGIIYFGIRCAQCWRICATLSAPATRGTTYALIRLPISSSGIATAAASWISGWL